MPAIIVRHWRLAIFNLVLLWIGAAVLFSYLLAPSTKAQQAPSPSDQTPVALDDVTNSQVALLRRELCLNSEDLAAMA